jgi:HYR domain
MKKLFTLLIALFSFLSMSWGQIYTHDFAAGSVSAGSYTSPPTFLASGLTSTGWSNVTDNSGGVLRKSPFASGSAFTLNLGVNVGSSLSIGSISFKHRINGPGTAQVKVNGSNFGASFTLSSGGATGTANITSGSGVPRSCLSGTVTVEVIITSASATSVIIDDFTINAPNPFNITGANKTICNADPASSDQAFGLSGSESGVQYELLRDGSPISPAVISTGAGSAFSFLGTFRAAGVYTVVKKCGSVNIPMTGSFTLQNVANPTGMVWSVADLLPICNGTSKPIAVTVTGGTPPYVISYNANSGSGPVGQNFPSYTSGPITVSPSATTTFSGASVIDINGCAVSPGTGLPTNSIVVNVNARPTGALSGGNPTSARVCSGATSTLSIAVTGTGPWSGTLSDGTMTPIPFNSTINPISSNVISVDVTPATTKTYTIATLSDANGCATIAADLTGSATVNVDNTVPIVSGAVNQTANTISTACNSGLVSYSIGVTDACATTYNWSASGETTIGASVPGSTTGTIVAGGGTFNVVGTFNKGVTGTTTINWSVTDGANTTAGSFTITVSDNVAPVPTCPTNPGPLATPLAPDPSQSYATVPSLVFTATDNCAVTTGSVALSGATLTNPLTTTLSGASVTLTGQRFPIGSTLVTYTVSDGTNTTACSFTVVVANNQAPLFLPCISNKTGTTGSTCTYTPTSPYSATIQDNAIGSVSMTYALSGATTASTTAVTTLGAIAGNQRLFTLPSIAFNKGVTTVTLTATGSSNTICSFTVTVTDDVRPTLTCPSPNLVVSAGALCTYTLPATAITFADNCSAVLGVLVDNGSTVTVGTLALSNTISGTLQKGVNTISLTATDGAGNTNLTPCSYTITVNDVTAPTFTATTCPGSQTVQTGVGATTCDKLVSGLLSAATDNCGSPTITRAVMPSPTSTPPPSFSNGNGNDASGTYAVGTTLIRFTATDGSGNASTCNFSIIVVDNTPPTIASCPPNVTVNPNVALNDPTPLNTCDYTQSYSITPSDNCTPTTTWGITGATTVSGTGASTGDRNFLTGLSTVTFTVSDGLVANNTTCVFTVRVVDNVAPVITCTTPSVSVFTTSGLCTGTATVTASATDLCNPSPLISYVLSGVTSGTGGNSVTQAFQRGPTIVTFTATDGTNTSTCQTFVTVTDNQPPTIVCPSTTTVNTLPNATTCAASVTISSLSPTDNCTIASTSFTKLFNLVTTSGTGTNPSGTYPVGATVVTFTTTDVAGLTGTCSFTVNVIDATNPKVICPANIVTSTGINVCTKTVSFAPSSSSDNCAVVSTSWSASGASPASGTTASGMALFPGGTTPVTFTVRDAQNNSGQCTFNVIVNDNEAPVITAINDVTINSSLGSTIDCAAPLSISASVTDNCGITLATGVAWTAPGAIPASGSGNAATSVLFPVGTTLVTYTATDNTGNNTSIETFNVVVVDNQAPIITGCPPTPPVTNMDNLVCYTTQTFSVTASDNCSSSLVTSWSVTNGAATLGSGSGLAINAFQFPAGNNIVTFTVSDGLTVPNTSTCQFIFTVKDFQPPVIAAIADVTINSSLVPTTDCAAPLSISASATDNCPITAIIYSWIAPGATPASGTGNSATSVLFPVGTTTVTYTATDAAGNTDTEVFDVLVVDNQAPVVTGCPTMPVALGTDNTNLSAPCTVSYSFTPTVEDNCTQTSVPPTQTQQAPPPPALVTYSWSITNSAASFSVTGTSAAISSTALPSGTNTVVFQATDAASTPNTSLATACTYTVIVTDDDKPVVTCPPSSSITLAPGTCTQAYSVPVPVSDNCTQPTFAWTISNGAVPATGTSQSVTAMLKIGANTVGYVATDLAGNHSTQCNFVVTIVDAQAPTFTCPPFSMVDVDAASCTNTYTNTPMVTDNCATVSLPTTYAWTIKNASMVTLFSGTTNAISGALPVGVNTVSFTATDASGNTSTACSYTVTVKDNIVPTITCPANVTVATGTDPGLCTASQSFAITATDNCPSNTLSYLWTVTKGISTVNSGTSSTVTALFPTGTSNVSFIAQDNVMPTSNTGICNFTVTVLDDEAPTFTAPANKSVPTNFTGCKWRGTLGTPTLLTENCPGVNYSWSVPSGTLGITPLTGAVGTTVTIDNGVSVTVTWVASDNQMPNANTASQTQTVSVQSTLALSSVTLADDSGISFTDGIVCQNGSVTLTATAIGGTPTYAYAWSPTSPAVSNGVAFVPTAATAPYVVTVTDASGCSINTAGNPITVVVKPTPTVTVAPTVPGSSGTNRIIICENAGNLVLTFATTGMSASGNTYAVISTGVGTSPGLSSLVGVTGFFAGGASSVSIPLPTTIATGLQFITLSFTSGDGCNTVGSQTFYINVNPGANASLVGTGILNPTPTRIICDATPAQVVRVNFTGTAPFSLIYSDGTTSYSVTNINSSATPGQNFYDITSSATTPGVYTIVACSDALGCSGNTPAGRSITIVDRRITISAQPQSVSVCSNTSATFSVTATAGASISYQWWSRPNALASGTVITGNVSAVTSTLIIPAAQVLVTPSGTEYYCILTNNAGGCADVSTTPATITVGAAITGVTAGADATVSGTSSYGLLGSIGTGTSGTWTVVPANALVIVTPASSPTATVSGLPVGTTTLRFTVTNGACTVSDDVVLTRAGIIVNITAALEGPLNSGTGEMNTNIRSVIPADGNSYPSTALRSVTGLLGIVDWITVELRTSPTTAATGIFVKQALIRADGKIVEPMDGISPLIFDVPNGSYYISVKHRNHLGFRSTLESLTASTTPYDFDFASGLYLAYGTATPGLKQISGVYCAYAGNINNTDNTVNTLDYNIWQATRFQSGYKPADINLDGTVNSVDYNLWVLNRFKTAQY